jgi:anaerobic selenocysteine-containing dehydrogenase
VRETPLLAELVADDALRINPHDFAALGVGPGTEVKLTAARASVRHPVVPDPAVPVGVAVMPFPADGSGAALLIDVDAPVTDLRVETLR